MSAGTRYSVVSRVERAATYRCSSCAFESPVTVIGVADASADASPLLGNHAAAEEKARRRSGLAAEADVARMLGLVKCPRCQKRDATWVRRFYAGQAGKLGGLWVAVTAFVGFVFARMDALPLLGVWAAAIVASGSIYGWVVDPRFEWSRAALCVRFPTDG